MTTNTQAQTLTSAQAHALFHFLTQHQAWHEFSSLKYPGRISHSGPPFIPDPLTPSRPPSPLLNFLFRRLFLTLPAVKDADPKLWNVHAQGLLEDMAAQDLSDSYDKGKLSKRKIVAYGIVMVAAYAARGALGGCPHRSEEGTKKDLDREYDVENEKDVRDAWLSVKEGLVYGDDVKELIEWARKTDDLSILPTRYIAAHHFASLTFASFLHYTLCASPSGPSLKALIARVHGMLPYVLVRQALRVGNAASMVKAVLKIFLYRAPSIRGMFGFKAQTPHQNLLQSIISTVLSSDQASLQRKLASLPTSSCTPEQIAAIDTYVLSSSREAKEAARATEGLSIVGAILAHASVELPDETTDDGRKVHAILFERLGLQLGIRDRSKMADVLCGRVVRTKAGVQTSDDNSTPTQGTADGLDADHLSSAIELIMSAFEPLLRTVHQKVDLSSALSDFQAFLDALLALPASASARDYADVVEKHEKSLHRFLHAIAKDEKLCEVYQEWYERCVGVYRRGESSSSSSPQSESASWSAGGSGAGTFQPALQKWLASLPPPDRDAIFEEAQAYASALSQREKESELRMSALFGAPSPTPSLAPSRTSIDSSRKKRWSLGGSRSRTSLDSTRSLPSSLNDQSTPMGTTGTMAPGKGTAGPGLWLAHWQHLIDATPVSPATLHGPVRYGAEESVRSSTTADVAAGEDVQVGGAGAALGGTGWPSMKVTARLGREWLEGWAVENWMNSEEM